jgi:hypothetical protein
MTIAITLANLTKEPRARQAFSLIFMQDPLPDFSRWTTARLKFLLEDYRAALANARGRKRRAEIILYVRWVKAMEAELEVRTATNALPLSDSICPKAGPMLQQGFPPPRRKWDSPREM